MADTTGPKSAGAATEAADKAATKAESAAAPEGAQSAPEQPPPKAIITPVESTRFARSGMARAAPAKLHRAAREQPRLRRPPPLIAPISRAARNRRRELAAHSINLIGLAIFAASLVQPFVTQIAAQETVLRLAFGAVFLFCLHKWAQHVLGDIED